MKTQENNNTAATRNEVTLISARKINGSKIELEFTQVVEIGEARQISLLSLLNASDERFTQNGKARHCWLSAEPGDATALTGIDFSELVELGDSMELDMVMPLIQGKEVNIQVVETTNGNDWEVANLEKSAKRAGKDGDFILSPEGAFIFTRTTIVLGSPRHKVIANTIRSSEELDINTEVKSALK